MARIPSGILGRLSGSISTVTGASVRGIPYIRERVTPANPKSAAQIVARNVLANVVRILRDFLPLTIRPNSRGFGGRASLWATLVGQSIRLTGSVVDPARMLFSLGPVAPPTGLSVSVDAETLGLSWEPSAPGNGTATDRIVVTLLHRDTGALLHVLQEQTREDEGAFFPTDVQLDNPALVRLVAWAERDTTIGRAIFSDSVTVYMDADGAGWVARYGGGHERPVTNSND